VTRSEILLVATLGLASGGLLLAAADAFATEEHPRKAVCTVCSERGESHGPEKVAAMSIHEGIPYYFCSKDCKEAFDTDPAGYMPQVFPRPAAGLAALDLDAQPVVLDDYEGQVLLLDFWATWCKPCVEIMPKLQELQDTYGGRGLHVLGISIDEKADRVREFAEKRNVEYRIAVDDADQPTWAAYGVKAVPTSFLIDRTGNIVARWVGKPDAAAVEEAVARALGKE